MARCNTKTNEEKEEKTEHSLLTPGSKMTKWLKSSVRWCMSVAVECFAYDIIAPVGAHGKVGQGGNRSSFRVTRRAVARIHRGSERFSKEK